MSIPPRVTIQDVDTAQIPKHPVLLRGFTKSVTCAHDNGTTEFLKIDQGTVLGKITASGKYRPNGFTEVDAAAAVNTLTARSAAGGTAANFFVGDVVTIFDVSGDVALATGRNVTVVDKGTGDITFDGAAVTTEDGDQVYLEDGSEDPVGILIADGIVFADGLDGAGATVYNDEGGTLMTSGTANEPDCTGATDDVKALLVHLEFQDPTAP